MTNSSAKQQEQRPPAIKHDALIEDAEVRNIEQKPAATTRLTALLAFMAISGVIGGLAFGYMQLQEMRTSLDELNQALYQAGRQQKALQSELKSMHDRLDSQESLFETRRSEIEVQQQRFSQHQNDLQQERERLQQQEERIEQALTRVQQKAGLDSSDWMLTEAAHLLRLADNKLHLEQDLPAALRALESADDRLRQAGDPGFKQGVAAEIAALKAVKRIDRAQLSTRLVEISRQIGSLPLADTGAELERKMTEPQVQAGFSAPDERSFRTLLQDSWQGFKSIMVVRRRDRPLSAMLSPEQLFFVRQNLSLQLEAARLALLRTDQPLYIASLQTAELWIAEFYDTEQQATRSLLEEVKKLQQQNLRPPLPDISGSLQALDNALRERGEPGESR